MADDFLEHRQHRMLISVKYYDRVDNDIEFVVFGEYIRGVQTDIPILTLTYQQLDFLV